MTTILIHRSLPCSAIIKKLRPVGDRKENKDPQLDNMQRVKDLGTQVLKRISPSNLCLQASGNSLKAV